MSEIAESLGLKTSTAHRIVTALERHGLIEREHATKRYRLGLALFALGATAADGTGLRKLCRPALLRLAGETGDTVFLMARSGLNVVCVDRQEGSYVLDSLTGHVGGQIPMGVGPASQAILAFLPEDEADAIIEANAPLYARYHGLSASKIRSRLPQIRTQRYALDHGELVEGISALAVPILPPKQRCGRIDRHQHDERAAGIRTIGRVARASTRPGHPYRRGHQSARGNGKARAIEHLKAPQMEPIAEQLSR